MRFGSELSVVVAMFNFCVNSLVDATQQKTVTDKDQDHRMITDIDRFYTHDYIPQDTGAFPNFLFSTSPSHRAGVVAKFTHDTFNDLAADMEFFLPGRGRKNKAKGKAKGKAAIPATAWPEQELMPNQLLRRSKQKTAKADDPSNDWWQDESEELASGVDYIPADLDEEIHVLAGRDWQIVGDLQALDDEVNGTENALNCDFDGTDADLKNVWLTNDEVKYAKCPPGDYLGMKTEAGIKLRTVRLRKAFCAAKKLGWQSGNQREGSQFKVRGFATYESSVWPKPPKCAVLPHEAWSNAHAKSRQYRPDTVPKWMPKLVNAERNMEFHQNWKVASTSFPEYLRCEFGGEWQWVPAFDPVDEDVTIGTAVREPIGRFISAASELLERSINHWCPHGPCGQKDSFDGNTTLDRIAHQTTWYDVISPDNGGFTMEKLHQLMHNMVSDTSCNYYTYACEHLNTQSNFVAQNQGEAAPLKAVVKLEELQAGLSNLARTATGNSLSGTCEFPRSNVKSDKPNSGSVPMSNEMMDVITKDPVLLQRLCLIYAQDFVCFDYDLPEVCHGMF